MSDKPGLVDMAIRQMNCGFNLPDGQTNFFWGGGGGGEFELHTEALYGRFFYEIPVYQKLFLKLI